MQLRFSRVGRVEGAGKLGLWRVEGDRLHLNSETWQCEGVIALSEVYLLCARADGSAERAQFKLDFEPDAGR